MRRVGIVLACVVALVGVARSGHELPVYPSYYPHEIELAALGPERAAELLPSGKIHAYVGRAPRFAQNPPAAVAAVESLGSFLVLRIEPGSRLAGEPGVACAALDAALGALLARPGEWAAHPYPVTPLHGDYLHHIDRAEAESARLRTLPPPAAPPRVRAQGALARALAGEANATSFDIALVEVSAAEIVGSAALASNGWLGPPWLKAGWFHAHRLLGDAPDEGGQHARLVGSLRALQDGRFESAAARINAERDFVALLNGGCTARVAGYTVKREFYNTEFSAGIENVAHDSLVGLNAPIFLRTAKLKDFPWNGWLILGVGAAPDAAWNPVAGFTDPFGRLMWSALGDPATIPAPYGPGVILNRISGVRATRGEKE